LGNASPVNRTVELHAIGPEDVRPVAEFLHKELNANITVAQWAAGISPPWAAAQPNHGFLLRAGEQVVGAHLALYSVREIEGRVERFCNLHAWCVLKDYRSHSLRLLLTLLSQKGYHFTDLTPCATVVTLNSALKFSHLDVTRVLIPNLPWPFLSPGTRVIYEPAEIERTLRGHDLEIYRDHARAAAEAFHVAVSKDGETCYVMFRRQRVKHLLLFASILHVGNQKLFRSTAGHVFRHILVHHRLPATLAELRVVGFRPMGSIMLKSKRPKMYRSENLRPEQIDYLYSELTCMQI
jgi:hypothetical protein